MKTQALPFPNSKTATAVFPTGSDAAEATAKELGLKPYKAVIVLLGGATAVDEKTTLRLTQLFGRGVARAIAGAGAVVVDGGIDVGALSMIGLAVAGRGYDTGLVGVASIERAGLHGNVATAGAEDAAYAGAASESSARDRLEPNHSHFVLLEKGGVDAETAALFQLASALRSVERPEDAGKPRKPSAVSSGVKLPVVVIVSGGEPALLDQVLVAVRHKFPIVVIEGSGGAADEIAAAWKQRDSLPDDPVMAEIVAEGDVNFHALTNPIEGMERLIVRELGVDKVLMQAWETFADYDYNANVQQERFNRLQIGILILGIVGTGLAIFKEVLSVDIADPFTGSFRQRLHSVLYHVLILVPIALTVLITAANRFKQGTKWLLLRAGAESIKREIYRYRTRAMDYKQNAEQTLAQRVEDISRRTMRTEANLTALTPYDKNQGFPPYVDASKGGDDGFSLLTPDRYVEVRLADQLRYFRNSAQKHEHLLRALYWATFVIGGIGTYLAAIGEQLWIALTTALVAAIGTYLGYRQTEHTLTKYNQAATDLASVTAWWNALSAEEQARSVNIDSLVEHTEQVLQSELDGWVQQMQNALAEMRRGQETPAEREEKKEPSEGPATSGTSKKPSGANADEAIEAIGAAATDDNGEQTAGKPMLDGDERADSPPDGVVIPGEKAARDETGISSTDQPLAPSSVEAAPKTR